MPKLGAYLSTLTNSRESCHETPFAPEQHVLWRALSRGDGDLPRAEALFLAGLRDLTAGSQNALDRIFCLQRGSEVAQERGDSQQGNRLRAKLPEYLV
jgi:hypothetical protein